jgi:hypothetical protein
MLDIPMKTQSQVRCRKCFEPLPETANCCEHCGYEIPSTAPKTLLGKIKRGLGIDLSSDIVTINLEDNGHFFTNQEIESLLKMENVKVLGLEDVPDRDAIFYKSKRIPKPANR